jgi:hypothetical protein
VIADSSIALANSIKEPPAPECARCQFFRPLEELRAKHGVCHRFPPQVFSEDGQSIPIVHPEFWCGEFKEGA